MTDNKFRKREVMMRCVPMNTLQAVLIAPFVFINYSTKSTGFQVMCRYYKIKST